MQKENKDLDENLEKDVAKEETTEEVKEESKKEEKSQDAKAQDVAEEKQDASDKNENPDKKKKRGLKKKDKKDEQIEELNDKYQRLFAEFQNFRSRSEKEKAAMFETGAKSIIEKILPVVDNFERGLAAIPEDEKGSAFAEGMEKIYKQKMTTLEEIGVTVIEAAGAEFDPNLHNAVMHVEDEELGENIVAEEFQKGYKYHDSVVRHSMVKVAN